MSPAVSRPRFLRRRRRGRVGAASLPTESTTSPVSRSGARSASYGGLPPIRPISASTSPASRRADVSSSHTATSCPASLTTVVSTSTSASPQGSTPSSGPVRSSVALRAVHSR